jgi:hypothetical protein
MADHAVGGIDRLVGEGARQPRHHHPEQRRHDPVGEILGQALDGGTADRGLVEGGRVAADDLRHGAPPAFDTFPLERTRDGGDMVVQAALRQQGAADQAGQQHRHDPGHQIPKGDRNAPSHQDRDRENKHKRDDAEQTARLERGQRVVPGLVTPSDDATDPAHGMADRPIERVGIAGGGLDGDSEKSQHGKHAAL